MKIGIDSYCYHRLFGEVYDMQEKPEKLKTVDDFLDMAKRLDVDGVSLETCFLPSLDDGYLRDLGIVWPALAPPWNRIIISASFASISVIFPFPSSPQLAPTTAFTIENSSLN